MTPLYEQLVGLLALRLGRHRTGHALRRCARLVPHPMSELRRDDVERLIPALLGAALLYRVDGASRRAMRQELEALAVDGDERTAEGASHGHA